MRLPSKEGVSGASLEKKMGLLVRQNAMHQQAHRLC